MRLDQCHQSVPYNVRLDVSFQKHLQFIVVNSLVKAPQQSIISLDAFMRWLYVLSFHNLHKHSVQKYQMILVHINQPADDQNLEAFLVQKKKSFVRCLQNNHHFSYSNMIVIEPTRPFLSTHSQMTSKMRIYITFDFNAPCFIVERKTGLRLCVMYLFVHVMFTL